MPASILSHRGERRQAPVRSHGALFGLLVNAALWLIVIALWHAVLR